MTIEILLSCTLAQQLHVDQVKHQRVCIYINIEHVKRIRRVLVLQVHIDSKNVDHLNNMYSNKAYFGALESPSNCCKEKTNTYIQHI